MHKILVVLLSILAFATFGHAADIYVKSKKAKVVKSPKKRSSLKSVKRGESLKRLKYRRKWYKVKVGSKTGWIYKGKISKKKPKEDPSLKAEGGGYNALAAEDVAAGSGLRGLGDLSLKYSESNKIGPKQRQFMDYHQSFITSDNFKPKITERGIEVVQISSEDIQKFLEEGKLGDYAEVEGDDWE